MPDPNPPAKPAAAPPTPVKSIGTEPAPQKAIGETDEDMVEVKQLKPYLGLEDKRVNDGKPYSVTRRRAAELHANNLATYVDPKNHDRHVEDEVRKAGDETRKKFEVKR